MQIKKKYLSRFHNKFVQNTIPLRLKYEGIYNLILIQLRIDCIMILKEFESPNSEREKKSIVYDRLIV